MKKVALLVAMLALVSSAMAWDIVDELKYTYTKSGYQQAGSDLVLPAMIGATSQASFYNPGAYCPDGSTAVWQTKAVVANKLDSVALDRNVFYPHVDLTRADFATTLTQGGSAKVSIHSMATPEIDRGVPEMEGAAKAYQDLQLFGGFGAASACFSSTAAVGADGVAAITSTDNPRTGSKETAYATVTANQYGGGEINTIDLGVAVNSGIKKSWDGSGWDTASYSGGITMWANFADACDPGCTNPIVSTVFGSAYSQALPFSWIQIT